MDCTISVAIDDRRGHFLKTLINDILALRLKLFYIEILLETKSTVKLHLLLLWVDYVLSSGNVQQHGVLYLAGTRVPGNTTW